MPTPEILIPLRIFKRSKPTLTRRIKSVFWQTRKKLRNPLRFWSTWPLARALHMRWRIRRPTLISHTLQKLEARTKSKCNVPPCAFVPMRDSHPIIRDRISPQTICRALLQRHLERFATRRYTSEWKQTISAIMNQDFCRTAKKHARKKLPHKYAGNDRGYLSKCE